MENTTNLISINTIYEYIIEYYDWQQYKESKKRLLRNKYAFLQKQLVLCDPKKFMDDSRNFPKNMIPICDAPIIRNLLIEAVNDVENDNLVYQWFNGNVDTNDSLKSILLYSQLRPLISGPEFTDDIDDVTVDEWMHTIAAAINYTTANNTLKLKKDLEKFRNTSLALDSNVGFGDIFVTQGNESRFYGLKGQKSHIDICGKTMEELLDSVCTQNDYFEILTQMLEMFEKHAKERVCYTIETFAIAKEAFEAESADDAFEHDSIASEYTIWYQRIYEFLIANPEECKNIEEKVNTSNLADFFKMKNRCGG